MLHDPAAPCMDRMRSSKTLGLDDAVFGRIADFVRGECGIKLSKSKSNLIVSRLGRRVRALNMRDFQTYLDYVGQPSGRAERRKMISLLTTNVTRFLREPHHFEALRTDVLPPLVTKAQTGESVRIWSAGCSTGEEPLSVGIEVLKLCPDAPKLDLRILATDLDPISLKTARAARYPIAGTVKIPDDDRARFFEDCDDGKTYRAHSALRDLITYAELNLLGEWPMERAFDVIFCRNVMIYFDKSTQAAIWPRFADALVPGGVLFIGHSERLSGPGSVRFEPAGITQYRRH